ncbi:hypothetical protein [Streptococcus sciuri]|uniref:Uncharacterized protein n=1 Tax=Streptococcus sciuri TaxID=2973939 RepID=A0ABT2F8V0_9STRE|nr:hypothetical protein [Streptococcus sciuri]MCS4488913.1 hypothetical protein [Streptococcus sciuri]
MKTVETLTAPVDDKSTKAKELYLLKTILAINKDIKLSEMTPDVDGQVGFIGMPTEEQANKLHQVLEDYSKLTGKTEFTINGQQYSDYHLSAILGLPYR